MGGFSSSSDNRFSLLSSGSSTSCLAAGDAGMVLSRFFSANPEVPAFLEVEEVSGLDRVVPATVELRVVLGVMGVRLVVPIGLATLCRVEVVEDGTTVRLAGVAATVPDEVVDGASDMRLGLAEMPSLPFSSPEAFSSTGPPEGLFWCAAVDEDETDPAGRRTVVVAVEEGLAGGLLRELEPPMLVLAAEEEGVGRVPVDSLGAVGFVNGFDAGRGGFVFKIEASSEAAFRAVVDLSMVVMH